MSFKQGSPGQKGHRGFPGEEGVSVSSSSFSSLMLWSLVYHQERMKLGVRKVLKPHSARKPTTVACAEIFDVEENEFNVVPEIKALSQIKAGVYFTGTLLPVMWFLMVTSHCMLYLVAVGPARASWTERTSGLQGLSWSQRREGRVLRTPSVTHSYIFYWMIK